jgi:hypothetical protein
LSACFDALCDPCQVPVEPIDFCTFDQQPGTAIDPRSPFTKVCDCGICMAVIERVRYSTECLDRWRSVSTLVDAEIEVGVGMALAANPGTA